jgi:hypothetical protein
MIISISNTYPFQLVRPVSEQHWYGHCMGNIDDNDSHLTGQPEGHKLVRPLAQKTDIKNGGNAPLSHHIPSI